MIPYNCSGSKKRVNSITLFDMIGAGIGASRTHVSHLLHLLYVGAYLGQRSFHEKPIRQVHLSIGQFS